MELYARVRRAVIVEKISEREVARQFGLARETVRKMLRYSVPPGYRRLQPVRRPKLSAWMGTIDQILETAQGRKSREAAPHRQTRSSIRLSRYEHSYAGGYTIVKDYVRLSKLESARRCFRAAGSPAGRRTRLTLAKRWW